MSSLTPDLATRLQAALGSQYRIERELGQGGMGVVFLATDTTLHRPVAVKVVHPELAVHPSITQRFLAEARMIARLRHPSIVAVHTAGETTGLFYYVMDFVPGESLRQRLNREGKLDIAVARQIVTDLAGALDAAGRAELVHRDVKPENVLLDSASGRALLADFGIARVMAGEGSSSMITAQGIAVGTPSYMSPEQAAGEPVDSRSDIYSLGVLAYEMLAGHPPFRGPNGAAVVAMQISERPVPIERLRPDTPPALAAAVMRALEKSPADRWQTGEAFRRAALDSHAGVLPTSRRRRVALMAGLVAVLATGVTVALASRVRQGPPGGVNPRHSILILPFNNLRKDVSLEWLRDGSVNMLGLTLSQWNDLTVVDHERLHDLMERRGLRVGDDIGLSAARDLAREAGVWTVVIGDFDKTGDSLHLTARMFDVATGDRVDVAQVDSRPGEDVRPMFDELAAKLLDLSGAPGELRAPLAAVTTPSLEAYRAYLRGLELLNRWDLLGADRELKRATELDTAFGLAYYKLALTRGWLNGAEDSTGMASITLATQHADKLPAHEREMITAYRNFLDGDLARSRGLYQQLLARDSTDADAWYGLGDAWFHDDQVEDRAAAFTRSLRAFRRTVALDPGYSLAYDHMNFMLDEAGKPSPYFALMPGDSFILARGPDGRRLLDSTRLAAAVARAREEGLTVARGWAERQPQTERAHYALINAQVTGRNFPGALAEVDRLRTLMAGAPHPELAFVEARVRFAQGDIDGAAALIRRASDSVVPPGFSPQAVPRDVLDDIAGAVNVFAYSGDLTSAARAIGTADRLRRAAFPDLYTGAHDPAIWERRQLGQLYAAAGGPIPALKRVWEASAEAARLAKPADRGHVAAMGAPAALGLFTGPEADQHAVTELAALTGEPLPPEVRALQALARSDLPATRAALEEAGRPAAAGSTDKNLVREDLRPLAAQAYFRLGDFQRTLDLLRDYEPEQFNTRGFDPRWGLLGRIRILRGLALDSLGRRTEARAQYRLALAQWTRPDPAIQIYLDMAKRELGDEVRGARD